MIFGLNKQYKISIITAVHNGAATIADCLNSVRSQTIAAEHVIIDGCSSDQTLAIVRSMSPQARVLSEPDNGMYDAMNKGIGLSRGDIIGILNADDFFAHSRILERVLSVFSDPAIEACYGDLFYIKPSIAERPLAPDDTSSFETVRYWRSGTYSPTSFYWGWMPPHPTFFVRRSIYERFGLFKCDLGSAADYELMLRLLLKHRIRAAYIPEVLVHMRTGGVSNASLENRLQANRMDRKAWEINNLQPYPWTFLCKPLRKLPQFFPFLRPVLSSEAQNV